jgi:hypothetical protein
MSLRPPRQFLIFIGKTLHYFGPRNIGTNFGQDQQRPSDNNRTRD